MQQNTLNTVPPSVRIWDLPTRVFHWAFAACIIGMFVSSNFSDINVHAKLGGVVASLWLWRVVWGFVGGHWSRFSSFFPTPARLKQVAAGHSATGALSVFAILLVVALQLFAGMGSDDEITFTGPLVPYLSAQTVEFLSHYHKGIGKVFVMALVVLHVLAIVYYALVKKKRLVPAMLHGDKTAADLADVSPWPVASTDTAASRLLALLLFVVCVGIVFGVVMA